MKTTTKPVMFVDKDNNVHVRVVSAYNDEHNKNTRKFIAKVNDYGYGFIVTNLNKK